MRFNYFASCSSSPEWVRPPLCCVCASARDKKQQRRRDTLNILVSHVRFMVIFYSAERLDEKLRHHQINKLCVFCMHVVCNAFVKTPTSYILEGVWKWRCVWKKFHSRQGAASKMIPDGGANSYLLQGFYFCSNGQGSFSVFWQLKFLEFYFGHF